MKKVYFLILVAFTCTHSLFAQETVFTRKTACGLNDGVHSGNVYLSQDYDFSYQAFYKYAGKLYGTWNDNTTKKQTTTEHISIRAYNCSNEKWTEITNISPDIVYNVHVPIVRLVTPNFIILSDGDIHQSPYEGNSLTYAYIIRRKNGRLVTRIDSTIVNTLSKQPGREWEVSNIVGKKVFIRILGTKNTVIYHLP